MDQAAELLRRGSAIRPSTAAIRPAWSAEAARDRLSSTLFLASLLHGIIILGVTFTAVRPEPRREPTSLDVVLVTRDYAQLPPDRDARLLATGTLTGRGNAPPNAQLRTSISAPERDLPPGPDRAGEGPNHEEAGTSVPSRELLTALRDGRGAVVADRPGAPTPAASTRPPLPSDGPPPDVLAEPDSRTVIPETRPREIAVSASTREAHIAAYLNTWKAKVERIGTLNFPRAAWLQSINTHPVVEVAIAANGDLREVVVRSSSGHRALDQAAVDIVHIAAPFEPFPAALREDFDVVRFAYEWHFTGGLASGRLRSLGGS